MNPYEQQFDVGDFFETIGNSAQSVIGGFGSTTTANATNAQAIANLNNAQADAVRARAVSTNQMVKYIGIALVILVVGIILRPVLAKIKFT